MIDLRGSPANAARGWLVTLCVVIGVGAFGAYWDSDSAEAVVAGCALAATALIGIPALLYFAFGVARVSTTGEHVSLAMLRGPTYRFHRREIRKCSVFALPRLSVNFVRVSTTKGAYLAVLSGFADDEQERIRSLLQPVDPASPAAR